jgi:hypothetical protein
MLSDKPNRYVAKGTRARRLGSGRQGQDIGQSVKMAGRAAAERTRQQREASRESSGLTMELRMTHHVSVREELRKSGFALVDELSVQPLSPRVIAVEETLL